MTKGKAEQISQFQHFFAFLEIIQSGLIQHVVAASHHPASGKTGFTISNKQYNVYL